MSGGKVIKNSRGNAVLEFALVLPILLLVVFGITEFGRAIMTVNILHQAAREGARLAAVSEDLDTVPIEAKVNQVLAASNIDATGIDITYDADEGTVRVEVRTDFTVLSGGVLDPFVGTIELSGATVMKYEL